MSTLYDADVAPDPREWLALPEQERLRLVQNYHVAAKVRGGGMKFHAVSHAIVETQIAQGYRPSIRAIARLQSQGLSRHEALHAIAAVNSQFAGELLQGQTEVQRASYQSRKNQAIDALHAGSLRG